MKRTFDLLLSTLLIIILSPILIGLFIAAWAQFGWPPLFTQTRPGYKGRIFEIIKFRSMTNATNTEGTLLPDYERITPFGSFLRRTSLDELPELINIFLGQMSFVGPRPLLVQYLERYNDEQARRHDVLPGLTGWAQVNGRNAITWQQKFGLDVWYVDHQSFLLDIKILWLTLAKVLRREGINQPGNATMEEFLGNDHQKDTK